MSGTTFDRLYWFNCIKKAWSPTIAVPHIEALALPLTRERQREAHAEYKIYSRAML